VSPRCASPQPPRVLVVTTIGQKLGPGGLDRGRVGEGIAPLERQNFAILSPHGNSAHTPAKGQGLGDGGVPDDLIRHVLLLDVLRAVLLKGKVAVDVVLDEWDVCLGRQVSQFQRSFVTHPTAERLLKLGGPSTARIVSCSISWRRASILKPSRLSVENSKAPQPMLSRICAKP
jgi:hypothetical protein